ncbi:MAG: long-chain fatty acid--CoA ligase, partial [Pseudomonadota bacterium]
WLWTGDLGFFDSRGLLTLSGRSKETIITGGSNVYPIEVENVLLAHPLVREAAVVGRRDADWGEVVVAFVVFDGEAGELDAWCREHLARFKCPKIYEMREALPKNAYGKVAKLEL